MSERATAEDTETQAPAQAAAVFGDDDLGRLQGILFGDHARKTGERIDTLEQALLGAIADLRDQMTEQIETVRAQLAAETETRTTAVSNLKSKTDKDNRAAVKETARVERTLTASLDRLKESLDSASGDARLEIEATRRDLAAQIEAAESELDTRKVDRAALAALFTATATELDGS